MTYVWNMNTYFLNFVYTGVFVASVIKCLQSLRMYAAGRYHR